MKELENRIANMQQDFDALLKELSDYLNSGDVELHSYKKYFARNFADMQAKLDAISEGINQIKTDKEGNK